MNTQTRLGHKKKKHTSYRLLSGIFLSTLSQTYSIYLHILDNTWWSGECQTLLQLYNSSGVVGNVGLRGKRPVWHKWANISMYLNAVRSYYPHLSKKGQCRGSTLLFALAQQEHPSCTNPANTSWTYIKKTLFPDTFKNYNCTNNRLIHVSPSVTACLSGVVDSKETPESGNAIRLQPLNYCLPGRFLCRCIKTFIKKIDVTCFMSPQLRCALQQDLNCWIKPDKPV